ncbi:RNA polymerase sigma factor [Neolewinella persica]|uniref:RNA polymerase sigma factor n=1 Tax=Neolewinella persica TaxID=70998 RepID=UPI00037A82AD|nr:sigma-70 family RNA polymerase sigma factor [Neolewinella persica]
MSDKTVTLEDMAVACSTGQVAAQRGLYKRLYPYVMSIALHYAGQREEAEEITQDSFVKLFYQLRKTVPTGSIRAYMSRVVINTSIDLIRKRKRQPITEEITDRYLNKAGRSRNLGSDRLEEAEIYRLLQMLPPSYRLVFNLHVLEGYTHPEIGEKLGISEGTSKSNLSKARKKLKQLAKDFYQLNEAYDFE